MSHFRFFFPAGHFAALLGLLSFASAIVPGRAEIYADSYADFSTLGDKAVGTKGWTYGYYSQTTNVAARTIGTFSTADMSVNPDGYRGPLWSGTDNAATPIHGALWLHPSDRAVVRRYTVGANGEPIPAGGTARIVGYFGEYVDYAEGKTNAFITVDGVTKFVQPIAGRNVLFDLVVPVQAGTVIDFGVNASDDGMNSDSTKVVARLATPGVPLATHLIASEYLSQQTELFREEAFRRVTEGGQSSAVADRFDTYPNAGVHQFAGLLYLENAASTTATRFDTVQFDTGGSDDNGGDFATLPKLYLLKHNSDTDRSDPSTDERFVDSGLVPSKFINVASTSSYSFDLTALSAEARTGYGFAVVATSPSGNANYITVCEISATTASAPAPVALTPFYVTFEGHRYGLTLTRGSWTECEAEAVAAGGHLVAITRATEQAFLLQTFGTQEHLFIGLKQAPGSNEPAGGFAWVTGEPFPDPNAPQAGDYTNWADGQPDNAEAEDRFVALNTFPGFWDDQPDAGYPKSSNYRGIIELPTPGTEPNAQSIVAGAANIFGAGKTGDDATPGGGVPPVLTDIPTGATSIQFSKVTGTVNSGGGTAGPDGFGPQAMESTDLTSDKGIAGLIDGSNAFMLVGVFVGSGTPVDPQPERLDFSSGALGENFTSLAPELGQVFFVGDGLTGTESGSPQQFIIPAGARRFYLGLADGQDGTNYHGPPNAYGDNSGEFLARFSFKDGPVIVPSQFPLSGALVVSGGTGALSFEVSAGQLPTGITLSADGTIGGAATANGTFTFTLKVTDASGRFSERTFTVVISNPVAVPSDLVAWFGADLAPHDSFGPHLGGLIGLVEFARAKVGYGFKFDGSSGYVEVPNDAAFALTGDLTIEGWIKPGAAPETQRVIASKRGATADDTTFLFTHGSDLQLRFATASGGTITEFSSGTTVPLDAFSHVAVTISGSELKFFINGTLASTHVLSAARPITDGPLTFGAQPFPGGALRFFAGIIDELSLYKAALSPAQLAEIFHAGSAGKFTYEIERGFSPTDNPNGPWSYGFIPAGTEPNVAAISNFTQNATDGPLQLWRRSGSTFPHVGRNSSANSYDPWLPGEIGMHPGQAGEYAVVRWTAPAAGAYTIASAFRLMYPTVDGVKVRIDVVTPDTGSGVQYQSLLEPNTKLDYNGALLYFRDEVRLAAGQQIVFIVDANATPTSDSTGLAVSITPTEATELEAPTDFQIVTKLPYANGREWLFTARDHDLAPGLTLLVEAGDGGSNWLPVGAMERETIGSERWSLKTSIIPVGPQIFRVRAVAPGAAEKKLLYPNDAAPFTLQVGTLPAVSAAAPLAILINKKAVTTGTVGQPWKFTAVQAADSTLPGLALEVQATATPTNESSWKGVSGGRMVRASATSTTWSVTTPLVPSGSVHFRTLTTADDRSAKGSTAVGPYTVIAGPRLEVTSTVESDSNANGSSTYPSEFITYRFTCKNLGNAPAVGATLEINRPSTTYFQGVDHASTCTTRNAKGVIVNDSTAVVVKWELGTLAPGAVVKRVMFVQVDPRATAKMTISLAGAKVKLGGPGLATVIAPKTLSSNVEDPLDITVSGNQTTVKPGALITYTLTARNRAGFDVREAMVKATVPLGTTFESAHLLDSQGLPANIGLVQAGTNPSISPFPFSDLTRQTLTWKLPKIPKASTRSVTFTVRVLYDVTSTYYANGLLSPAAIELNEFSFFGINDTGSAVTASPLTKERLYTLISGESTAVPQLRLTKTVAAEAIMSIADNDSDPNPNVYKAINPIIQSIDTDALRVKTASGGDEVVSMPGAAAGRLNVTTVVPFPNVAKSVDGIVTYKLHYENRGTATAREVRIVEELPAGFSPPSNGKSAPSVKYASFLGYLRNGPDENNTAGISAGGAILKDGAGHPIPSTDAARYKDVRSVEFLLGDLPAHSKGVFTYEMVINSVAPVGSYIISRGYIDPKVADTTNLGSSPLDKALKTLDNASRGYSLRSRSLAGVVAGSPDAVYVKVVQAAHFDEPTVEEVIDLASNPDPAFAHSVLGDRGVSPGGVFKYVIRFQNKGGLNAQNTELRVPIPTGTVVEAAFDANDAALSSSQFRVDGAAGKPKTFVYFAGTVPAHSGEQSFKLRLRVRNPANLQDKAELPKNFAFGNTLDPVKATLTFSYGNSNAAAAARQLLSLSSTPAQLYVGNAAESLTVKTPVNTGAIGPILFIERDGPTAVRVGGKYEVRILVGNRGTEVAKNVQLGFQTTYGSTSPVARPTASATRGDYPIFTWKPGDLQPGQSFSAKVSMVAALEGHWVENSAYVRADNHGDVAAGPMGISNVRGNPINFLHAILDHALSLKGFSGEGLRTTSDQFGADDLIRKAGSPRQYHFGNIFGGVHRDRANPANAFAIMVGGPNTKFYFGPHSLIGQDGAGLIGQDGGGLIGQDAAKLIGQDAAGVVAGGAGNLLNITGVGLLTETNVNAFLTNNPKVLVVAGGGGNLIGQDGAGVVAGGAGNLKLDGAGRVVAGGAGNVVAGGAGNVVAGGAGNVVAGGAGNIFIFGGGVVAGGAGNLVPSTGLIPNAAALSTLQGLGNLSSGVVAGGAGNVVAGGAGN